MMLNDTLNYFLSMKVSIEIHVVRNNMHRCSSFGVKAFLLQVKDHSVMAAFDSAAIATSTGISFPPEQFLGSIWFGKIECFIFYLKFVSN